jgi:hypothetical protein
MCTAVPSTTWPEWNCRTMGNRICGPGSPLPAQLPAVQATVPPKASLLAMQLGGVASGPVLWEDLREFAGGIHPAPLVKGR